jgi:hypothetical protein
MTDPIGTRPTPTQNPAKQASVAQSSTPALSASWAANPAAITLSLKAGDNSDEALKKGLASVYEAFYKNDAAAAKTAIDKAFSAIKSAITDGAKSGADAIQFRIVTIATSYGAPTDAVSLGGASELGIEASFVKSGKVTPAQTALVDISGGQIALSPTQISDGHGAGFYRRSQDMTGLGTLTPENAKYFQEAQKALNDIQRTADVLTAYVHGNAKPLADLIKQQLSGRA